MVTRQRIKIGLAVLAVFFVAFLYFYMANAAVPPLERPVEPTKDPKVPTPEPTKEPALEPEAMPAIIIEKPPLERPKEPTIMEPAEAPKVTPEPTKEPVKVPTKEPTLEPPEAPKIEVPPPPVVDPEAEWIPDFINHAKEYDSSRHCLAGEWKDGNYFPSEACENTLRKGPPPRPIKPVWILILGDSNFRRVYTDLCVAFGLASTHGLNQYSDRDCFDENVRVSLRFVPLWSHVGGTQGDKVSKAIFNPELGLEHVQLENGGYTWNFDRPWDIPWETKPLVIWNFGLWELMSKGDDDAFHRRVVATLKYRLQQIKEADKWLDIWTFVTTPRVVPTDDKRKGLLTEERITALNAIITKAVLDTDHQVIDWYKVSKANPTFLADGYHLDGKLYEVAFQSILGVVIKHIEFINGHPQ